MSIPVVAIRISSANFGPGTGSDPLKSNRTRGSGSVKFDPCIAQRFGSRFRAIKKLPEPELGLDRSEPRTGIRIQSASMPATGTEAEGVVSVRSRSSQVITNSSIGSGTLLRFSSEMLWRAHSSPRMEAAADLVLLSSGQDLQISGIQRTSKHYYESGLPRPCHLDIRLFSQTRGIWPSPCTG